MMSYRELLAQLAAMPDERLDDNVTIYGSATQEAFAVEDLVTSTDLDITDVLDPGHLVLIYVG